MGAHLGDFALWRVGRDNDDAADAGAGIKRELETLGKIGEIAFKKLQKSAAATKLDTGFGRALAVVRVRLRELAAVGGQISKGFAPVARSLNDVGAAAGTVARRIGLITGAAAAAGGALLKFSADTANAADEAGRSAQKLGLTVQEFGRLSFAARQADVDAGSFGTAITKLAQNLGKLPGDGDESATVFSRLGIAIRDAKGQLLPMEQIISNTADAFARLEDGPVKTAAAIQIFGRSGADLIPLLNEGGAALKSLGDEAERFGIVFSASQAKAGDAFGDALGSIKAALEGIRNAATLPVIEVAPAGLNALAEAIASQRAAISAFAQTVVDEAVPAIKDLFAAFSGNDAAVQNPAILQFRDDVVAFGKDLQATYTDIIKPVFEGIKTAAQLVADGINAVFGTELNGRMVLIATAVGIVTGVFGALAAIIGTVVAVVGGIVTGITALVAAFGAIPVAIGAAIIALGAIIFANWDSIVEGLTFVWDSIVEGAAALWDKVTGIFESAVAAIPGLFEAALADVRAFFDSLVDFAISAAKKIGSALSNALEAVGFSGGGEVGGAANFASGGAVHGPGTGTSDSVPAWLSAGEFVQPTKSVRKYGVGFMEALRRGLIPVDEIRQLMSGMSIDGVTRGLHRAFAMPAFANGGLVGAMAGGLDALPAANGVSGRPVTLNINAESFGPMIAPVDVIDELTRHAMKRNLARIGQRQSWYGR